jgi:hypothetical protein
MNDEARCGGMPVRIGLADGRLIHGSVDDRYAPVLDTFCANSAEGGDLGAACAAYVGGRQVIDLWGGLADRRSGRPWEPETAAVILSRSGESLQ